MKAYKAIILTIFVAGFFSLSAFAQKNYTEEADKAFGLEQYNNAVEKYKKAYTKINNKPEKNRILYQIAECYRMSGSTKNAEAAYKRVIKLNYFKQEPKSYLYYADALRANENYDEALTNYNNYIKLAPDDQRGKFGAESCTKIKQWLEKPTRYEVTNMKKFNTKDNEWSPAFSDRKKYNELVFTSTREGTTGKGQDAWTGSGFSDFFSVNQDRKGNWSAVDLYDKENIINTEANEGVASFNETGSSIYFTRCPNENKKRLGCFIYNSKKKGKGWEEAERVELGSEDYDFIHPAISGDELTIYFASNMPGGQGEFDIWCAKRDKKNKPFGKPVNLGPSINTAGKEEFPTLRYDTVLYFSSNCLPGLGGYDIFKTSKVNDEWTAPKNMGSPINSSGDDLSIVFFPDGEKGFMSSNRKGGRGGDDIYSVYLPPLLYTLKGTIRDDNTLQLLEGVNVKLVGSNGTSIETKTDKKGIYKFDNKQFVWNVTYNIEVTKKGYLNNNNKGTESTVALEANKDFVHDFRLTPIPIAPVLLPEILYDLAKWDLKEQYQDSLIDLIRTMEANPRLVIELRSHTDSRRIPMTNDTLSQRRAQSVVDYLITRGINQARLVARGYGEKVPRHLTRETNVMYKGKDGKMLPGKLYTFPEGVTLNDEYINSLRNVDEKEAAHQLNRRTEFSILRDDYVPSATQDSIATGFALINSLDSDNVVSYKPATNNGLPEANCIINNVAMKLSVNETAKTATFSYDQAMKFLKELRISKKDFKENEKAFDSEGNIVEKSVIILREVKLANGKILNVEATVIKNMKVDLILNKPAMEMFGSYTISKEKKQIILNNK